MPIEKWGTVSVFVAFPVKDLMAENGLGLSPLR